jgi:hypothetical protein
LCADDAADPLPLAVMAPAQAVRPKAAPSLRPAIEAGLGPLDGGSKKKPGPVHTVVVASDTHGSAEVWTRCAICGSRSLLCPCSTGVDRTVPHTAAVTAADDGGSKAIQPENKDASSGSDEEEEEGTAGSESTGKAKKAKKKGKKKKKK